MQLRLTISGVHGSVFKSQNLEHYLLAAMVIDTIYFKTLHVHDCLVEKDHVVRGPESASVGPDFVHTQGVCVTYFTL